MCPYRTRGRHRWLALAAAIAICGITGWMVEARETLGTPQAVRAAMVSGRTGLAPVPVDIRDFSRTPGRSADAVAPAGRVIYRDDFSDPGSGWPVDDNATGAVGYAY